MFYVFLYLMVIFWYLAKCPMQGKGKVYAKKLGRPHNNFHIIPTSETTFITIGLKTTMSSKSNIKTPNTGFSSFFVNEQMHMRSWQFMNAGRKLNLFNPGSS